MGWFRRRRKNGYIKNQINIISNLGLFYIIVLALFGIPLVGTFVVVLIKGVVDLRFVITPVIVLLFGLIVFFVIRVLGRMVRRMAKDGQDTMDAALQEHRKGHSVQISFLNGFFSLTFGNPQAPKALPPAPTPESLPAPPEGKDDQDKNIVGQLKQLADLRDAGEINREEFDLLKEELISASCRQKN